MIRSRRYVVVAFAVGAAVCAVDVVSKIVVVAELSGHSPVTVLGGLITLQLYRNGGAAFGVGPSFTAMYALVAAAVLVAILRVSRRLQSWLWAVALGLVLGGAAGNLADRLFRSPGPMRGCAKASAEPGRAGGSSTSSARIPSSTLPGGAPGLTSAFPGASPSRSTPTGWRPPCATSTPARSSPP